MRWIYKKLTVLVARSRQRRRPAPRRIRERELIRLEADIGRELFGPIPIGRRREFFCLDATTWVWQEEWIEEPTRRKKTSTIRYEIRGGGVQKTDERACYYLHGAELQHFAQATQAYYERVVREIYEHDPQTGRRV